MRRSAGKMNSRIEHDAAERVVSDIREWLVGGILNERFIDDVLLQFCERLSSAGIPVARSALYFYTQNPEWLGARIVWERNDTAAKITTFAYGVEDTDAYQNSPVRALNEGAAIVRQRLDTGAYGLSRFYDELRWQGLTDYVAWPLMHSLGKRHAITFATDVVGGFTKAHLELLSKLIPTFAVVSEVRVKNHMMRTLLNTYVGPHAASQIIAGATTRGRGVTVRAAIVVCDLRDFTSMSDQLPGDEVIGLLNRFFDAMTEPLVRHGGEILKFIGDGFLAMVPTSERDACDRVVLAVDDMAHAFKAFNLANEEGGLPQLEYGVGVHVGDVMYGNLGTRNRLDFTVIGPAVNVAARLEGMTKVLKERVLVSKAFQDLLQLEGRIQSLGEFKLKGLEDPVEIFSIDQGL